MSYFFNKLTLLIVVGIVVIVGLSFNEIGKLGSSVKISQKIAYAQWLDRKQNTFKTQEDCQKQTAMLCSYVTCNAGSETTSDQACEKNYESGWKQTLVPIPTLYQDLASIQLSITTPTRVGVLSVTPDDRSMLYTSDSRTKKSQASQTQTLAGTDITRLINKMILYEFAKESHMQTTFPTSTVDKIYTIAVSANNADSNPPDVNGYSVSCAQNQCSRDFTDIRDTIIGLWNGIIIESESL